LDGFGHGRAIAERGLEPGGPEDLNGEANDVLVEEQVRACEPGVQDGDERSGDEGRDRGGDRGGGAGAGHCAHTSKKLNHCVGCARTTSSRNRTHVRAASSSSPRPTTSGVPTRSV